MITYPKPYPKYRHSGIPWLGEVPEHWEVRKLRQVLRQVAVRNRPDLPLLSVVREKGVIIRDISSQDENHNYIPDDLSNYKVVLEGQFAMNKMKAWQGSYGVSPYNGIVSPAYFTFDIRGLEENYFHTAIRSRSYIHFFTQASDGVRIGQWDLSIARMREIPFYIPPLSEQSAIVRFLDHADRKIRRIVHAKQKLIKLLEEQKQAIINLSVTKGLNLDVPMKESGVAWLGEVPEHWVVRRIRNAAEMRVSNVDKHMKEAELPVRLCNYIDVYKNERIKDNLPFMRATATEEEIRCFRLAFGDVLITKDSEVWNDIGVPALVEYTAEDLICGYHLALLRPRIPLLSGAYLFRTLQSPVIAYQFHIEANGVTRYGLSHGAIKSAVLPIPPLQEQAAIVSFLDDATTNIIVAIDRAQREIKLLREYHTRLIADVVTGKLDVRQAAANLPDIEEKPGLMEEADIGEGTNAMEEPSLESEE